MAESSIYFSTQTKETFGMAIVEAMSAGCVPLVYRNGGPWYDILGGKEGVGLAYDTVEEASRKIRHVMGDEVLRETLRRRSMERSKVFSVDRFRGKMRSILESMEPRNRSSGNAINLLDKINQWKKGLGFNRRS
jgi:glycosyltransferase involved in cell wall biosynthesis